MDNLRRVGPRDKPEVRASRPADGKLRRMVRDGKSRTLLGWRVSTMSSGGGGSVFRSAH
jgi:hypothetical protein